MRRWRARRGRAAPRDRSRDRASGGRALANRERRRGVVRRRQHREHRRDRHGRRRAPAWLEAAAAARAARGAATATSSCVAGWPEEVRGSRASRRGTPRRSGTLTRGDRNGEPRAADAERRARRRRGRCASRARAGRASSSPRSTATRRSSRSRSSRVHITTAVADSFAPIRLIDVFVPFVGAYRPLWLGLGHRRVRPAARARHHEPAARAHRLRRLARGALGRVRGVAGRAAARPRHRERHARALGGRRQRGVSRGGARRGARPRVGWTRAASGGRRALAAFGSVAVAARGERVDDPRADAPGLGAQGRHAERADSRHAARQRAPRPRVRRVDPDPVHERDAGHDPADAAASGGIDTVTIDARLPSVPGARLRVTIEGTPARGRRRADAARHASRSASTASPDLYQGSVVSLDGTNVRRVVARPERRAGHARR